MLNFSMGVFWIQLSSLHYERDFALAKSHDKNPIIAMTTVGQADSQRIQGNLRGIFEQCGRLGLESCSRTLVRLEDMFSRPFGWSELASLLQRLCEDIEHDVKKEYFFHYSKDNADLVHNAPQHWAVAFKAFSSTRDETLAGVDCYALDDYSGCIFHMCRAAEAGLRTIGRERGIKQVRSRGQLIPLDWGTWGQIVGAIDSALVDIRKNMPNGPERDAALTFYDSVLSDLRAIQNYRDKTMHLRDRFDEGEAKSAMFRVHAFMTRLAEKLDENSTRAIPWKAWK